MIADLMQLRTVVDGLLRSPTDTGADHQQPIDTEGTGATVPELSSHSAASEPVHAAQPGSARRTRRSSGADHHQSNRTIAVERTTGTVTNK
jgi:hypothetical protein